MSFKYPDFTKYFNGPQKLPTEIMMMIHDWGRSTIKKRANDLLITPLEPLMDNKVYDVAPRTTIIINSRYYDKNEPFLMVSITGKMYLEYHSPKSLNVKRVFRDIDDYSVIGTEVLLANGKVFNRPVVPRKRNKFT